MRVNVNVRDEGRKKGKIKKTREGKAERGMK